jgi:hypothetical protein
MPCRSSETLAGAKHASDTRLTKNPTHLALVQLGHLDNLHVLLLLLEPFEQRFGEDEVVTTAIVDRQGRETIIEPPIERVVQRAFAVGKAALAAPPATVSVGSSCKNYDMGHYRPARAEIAGGVFAKEGSGRSGSVDGFADTHQKILAELTGVGVKRNILVLRRCSLVPVSKRLSDAALT